MMVEFSRNQRVRAGADYDTNTAAAVLRLIPSRRTSSQAMSIA